MHNGSLFGLFGTYDDLIQALDGPLSYLQTSDITYLWFGNSFANASPGSSVAFLSKLLASKHEHMKPNMPRTRALVAIDGCRDVERVFEAYGTHNAVHQEFLFHGLHHANEVLGQNVFFEDHWGLNTHFDESSDLLLQNFVAKRSLDLLIDGKHFKISRGEKVNICQSGKWQRQQVKVLLETGGLQIVEEWQHEDEDYGESDYSHSELYGRAPSSPEAAVQATILTEYRYVPSASTVACTIGQARNLVLFTSPWSEFTTLSSQMPT